MKNLTLNEKGIMLMWFYLLFIVLLIVGGSLYELCFGESRLVAVEQARDKAFYLAEAGIDKKLLEVRAKNFNAIAQTTLGAGTYEATYCGPSGTSCGDSSNPTIAKITAVGTVGSISKRLVAVIKKELPPGAKGAITSNSSVSMNGNIVVDGRDYYENGTLVGGTTDSFGVASGGTVSQGGSNTIGGNGYAPAQPANPAAISENDPNAIFSSIEGPLGLLGGDLDQYKVSTPPATPFHGIYYLTTSWNAPDFGTAADPSTGILIVHNSTNNAELKNVHGYFKGLILTDELVHLNGNADITGAVILHTMTGNVIGNGNAFIKYSSEVLNNLPLVNFSIVAWEDEQNH